MSVEKDNMNLISDRSATEYREPFVRRFIALCFIILIVLGNIYIVRNVLGQSATFIVSSMQLVGLVCFVGIIAYGFRTLLKSAKLMR